ncbi:hypothetical protein NAI44_09285, partial [Francisella tularensis subsp. holarctica]|uniref:hypothetical protein n=1 Tax=Francisella tularensis TaxID=263 RepID=UPI0023ACF530|nr:hypothetical protein [Francisella tularensis subsp. holarctica]
FEGLVSSSDLNQIKDIFLDSMVEVLFSWIDDLFIIFSVKAQKEIDFFNFLETLGLFVKYIFVNLFGVVVLALIKKDITPKTIIVFLLVLNI